MVRARCACCCGRGRATTSRLARTLALAEPILGGLGFGAGRAPPSRPTIRTRSGRRCARSPAGAGPAARGFQPIRQARRAAARVARAAPCGTGADRRGGAAGGAPFGKVEINVEGCTLCLACVSACPTGALVERSASARCCASSRTPACNAGCARRRVREGDQPRAAARLPGRDRTPRVLKEEEPFLCIRCAKPFGVKSTIERVTAKLEGKHWMFKGSAQRLDCSRCARTAASSP